MQQQENEAGRIKVTTTFGLSVLGLFLYSAFQVGHIYYDFLSLKTYARDILRVPKSYNYTSEILHKKFDLYVVKINAPVPSNKIEAYADKERLSIYVRYNDYFTLFGRDIHVFKFKIDEEREY